jgi:regulator of sigma E protease
VQEPDSSAQSERQIVLKDWLRGAEDPDPLGALGLQRWYPAAPPLVAGVREGSVGERAGLRKGDRLLSMNGQALASPETVVAQTRALAGSEIELRFQRGEEVFTRSLRLPSEQEAQAGAGYLGAMLSTDPLPPEMLRHVSFGPLEAVVEGARRTWVMSLMTLDSLKKMLFGELSVKNLSGPITIAKVAGASAQSGIGDFLNFLAILSISLGVLNLLPIPVLDGGHLLFYLVEWVRGRPLSDRVQTWGVQIGISFVLGVMILALANDLGRL